jgi:acyl-coenzyme A thioesterase PaaI-like protein
MSDPNSPMPQPAAAPAHAEGSAAPGQEADAEARARFARTVLTGRWQEPPPDQMTSRRVEMRRLADSMRIIIERLVATAAPTEAIIEVADQLARAALAFEHWPHGTLYEGFAEAANAGGDPHAMFEHSPLIGQANPLAPPMRLLDLDGVVHGQVTFGSAYEGPPGCVHGGYIAAAFDELLGATQSLSGNPGMTGRLTTHYRSPTPLHAELHLVGRIVRIDGRKIFTEGQLYATEHDGTERLCAESEGLFISIDFGQFADLKAQREQAERDRMAR